MRAIILAGTILGLAFAAAAQQAGGNFQITTPGVYLEWDDPKWWELFATEKPSGIQLGRSDFTLEGPLVESLRRRPRPAIDRTPAQRIMDLPVISLFVPQPIPLPSGPRKYLAWGDRSVPWATTADRGMPGPLGRLVSVGY